MDRATSGLIRDYHRRQGDRCIRPMGIVRHPAGGSAALVRLRDGNGIEMAVLDLISTDGRGQRYVSELRAMPAEEEKELIEWFREEG